MSLKYKLNCYIRLILCRPSGAYKFCSIPVYQDNAPPGLMIFVTFLSVFEGKEIVNVAI